MIVDLTFLPTAILALLTAQRAGELLWARRNTAALLRAGAVEAASGHYPLIVLLHAAWLAGLWLAAPGRPVDLRFLAVLAILQAGRLWVLATLGRRWTTRILVVPGERLLAAGPYRYVRHPNYLVVAGEIATVPLAFGLVLYAAVFSVLNGILLFVRIRSEEAALASARPPGPRS